MTAVMRRAEAVLHALMMIRSSMRPSLMSPGAVDWRTKTRRNGVASVCGEREVGFEGVGGKGGESGGANVPSSSRTDSPMVTEVS